MVTTRIHYRYRFNIKNQKNYKVLYIYLYIYAKVYTKYTRYIDRSKTRKRISHAKWSVCWLADGVCVYDSVTSDKLNTRPSHSGKYLGWVEEGDTRIVCAAVAKSEMIFRVDQKRGNRKKRREWSSLSSLSTPCPPSPSSVGLGSGGGGATKSDKN